LCYRGEPLRYEQEVFRANQKPAQTRRIADRFFASLNGHSSPSFGWVLFLTLKEQAPVNFYLASGLTDFLSSAIT
jgi:hypothetical protein